MLTEQDVIQSIQGNYKINKCYFFLVALLTPMVFVAGWFIYSKMMIDSGIVVAYWIACIIATIIVDFFVVYRIMIKGNKKPRDPKHILSDPVFRAFTSVSDLTVALNEAKNQETVYSIEGTKITGKYIVDFSDYRSIMRLEDVINITAGPGATGNEGCRMLVSDCHNRTYLYPVSSDPNVIRHIKEILHKRCPHLGQEAAKQA